MITYEESKRIHAALRTPGTKLSANGVYSYTVEGTLPHTLTPWVKMVVVTSNRGRRMMFDMEGLMYMVHRGDMNICT